MPPRILRIVGASYSGSTALGYFLDTGAGVHFGSELYRLLPAHLQGGPDVPCDACGDRCSVWTPALRQALRDQPQAGLRDVYAAFFAHMPEARALVDGSKSPRWYTDDGQDLGWPLHYLVTVRHPLRLLASHLLNDQAFVPAASRADLAQAHAWLLGHEAQARRQLDRLAGELAARYRVVASLVNAGQAWQRCRMDDSTALTTLLDELGRMLGCRFDPQALGAKPCHAVGGNRSLAWQVNGWQAAPLNPVRDQARFAYYRQRVQGGLLRDDKHRQLLAGAAWDWAREAASRHGLFDSLGYADDQAAA